MATTKCNQILGATSAPQSPIANEDFPENSNESSLLWADRVEQFSTRSAKQNMFCGRAETALFFVVKSLQDSFTRMSPFLIEKTIKSAVGTVKCTKKLRSGDLLIQVESQKQAECLRKLKNFGPVAVSVSAHGSLNTSRGVISERDLQYCPENEILDNLRPNHVTAVRRIYIHKQGEKIPTKHLILTFDKPTLPSSVKAGYLNCVVRPYIPNPLRCFQCQKFGHSKFSCRGSIACARCGAAGHESTSCSAPYSCINCKKEHPAYSKTCEKWIQEKEIQTVRTKENISYIEAKKKVVARTPIPGVSYAAVASTLPKSATKTFASIAVQTDVSNFCVTQAELPKNIEVQTTTFKPSTQPSSNIKTLNPSVQNKSTSNTKKQRTDHSKQPEAQSSGKKQKKRVKHQNPLSLVENRSSEDLNDESENTRDQTLTTKGKIRSEATLSLSCSSLSEMEEDIVPQ